MICASSKLILMYTVSRSYTVRPICRLSAILLQLSATSDSSGLIPTVSDTARDVGTSSESLALCAAPSPTVSKVSKKVPKLSATHSEVSAIPSKVLVTLPKHWPTHQTVLIHTPGCGRKCRGHFREYRRHVVIILGRI